MGWLVQIFGFIKYLCLNMLCFTLIISYGLYNIKTSIDNVFLFSNLEKFQAIIILSASYNLKRVLCLKYHSCILDVCRSVMINLFFASVWSQQLHHYTRPYIT
jgi:hypothetical protein